MSSKVPSAKKSALDESEQPRLDLRPEEDFAPKYANHVSTVQTGYDLKVTFGRIDPSVGPNVVLQNSAVVLSWPAVKTLIYFLRLSLIAYEEGHGHVPYPPGMITPPPGTVPADILASFPKAKAINEKLLKLWDDFVRENPETQPEK